jgi:hypothetical protein
VWREAIESVERAWRGHRKRWVEVTARLGVLGVGEAVKGPSKAMG